MRSLAAFPVVAAGGWSAATPCFLVVTRSTGASKSGLYSRAPTRRFEMTIRTTFRVLVLAAVLLIGAAAGTERDAAGVLPPGNTVEQWNKIAEDTVVGSGTFQIEGLIYMAYESSAVYDAVVSLQGGYQPLEPAFRVSKTASPDLRSSQLPTRRSGTTSRPGMPASMRRTRRRWRRSPTARPRCPACRSVSWPPTR